jgi:transcriptional regulator with XRE-family HTH domain
MAHVDIATAEVTGGAESVNALLTELGLSQRELARRLGWTQPKLHRRLSGVQAITVAEMELFAAVLGVPVTQLIPTDAAEVTA